MLINIPPHSAKLALLAVAISWGSATHAQLALDLIPGWNLVGNSEGTAIDVAAKLGDPSKINTVWKWNKATGRWAFYAPSMTASALTTYAQAKGYDVLTSIAPKDGFWVNASSAVAVAGPSTNPEMLVESDLESG